MGGSSLWVNFLTSLRPHTIRAWTKPMQIEWFDLMRRRGIYIQDNIALPMIECIIDLLYISDHISKEDWDATIYVCIKDDGDDYISGENNADNQEVQVADQS